MPPTPIDKGAGRKIGYFPDYSVWHLGLPLMIIEAKSPSEHTEEGLRESRLYATEINKRYPPNLNPVLFILSTNGRTLSFCHWDSEDLQTYNVNDLVIGSVALTEMREVLRYDLLVDYSKAFSLKLRKGHLFLPANRIGGRQLLSTPLGLNSFANDLFPLIQMYFGVEGRENTKEIVRRAYVSTDETTRYEANLETFLREKVRQLDTHEFEPIHTTKTSEEKLTKQISQYTTNPNYYGRIQLLIGAVGAGKSTFAERYYEHLLPNNLRGKTYWSFVNFNSAPDDLADAENWICRSFTGSFVEKNSFDSLYDIKNLKRIFSPDINKRDRGPYATLKKTQPDEYERRIAADLVTWMDDPRRLAECICRYFIGEKRMSVVVVIDNVDRRDREQQLKIFQVAQWFKDLTRAFCILALRDTTYEAFKSEPPLNAFLHAVNFYITPPRFTDVIRKRLNLAIEYLTSVSPDQLSYELPNGMKIKYPASDLGKYLIALYVALFHKRTQVAGAIEALTGKDVRRALAMFSDLIVSRHLSEVDVIKVVAKPEDFNISEATIIRILMRTRYKFFLEENGYITNILDCSPEWIRPSNFLYVEILEYLASNRKTRGDVRLEGYFSVPTILDAVQRLGFVEDDVFAALAHLLGRGLIVSDFQRSRRLTPDDAVRVHASGFIHLRFFCKRYEYLSGVLPATHVFSDGMARRIADLWNLPPQVRDIRTPRKIELIEEFLRYLSEEYEIRCKRHAFYDDHAIGSKKLIRYVGDAIAFSKTPYTPKGERGPEFE